MAWRQRGAIELDLSTLDPGSGAGMTTTLYSCGSHTLPSCRDAGSPYRHAGTQTHPTVMPAKAGIQASEGALVPPTLNSYGRENPWTG